MEKNPRSVNPDSADGKFHRLVASKTRMSITLTILMVAGYFGYIGSLAYQKELLSQKVGVHITLGVPLGLGIILLAWLLTGFYVWWANNIYDRNVADIKNSPR